MFIQTESTPNPLTMKFLPGQSVIEKGAMEFKDIDGAANAPLAQALLGISGVVTVM